MSERFIFVLEGQLTQPPDFTSLMAMDSVRAYLGDLAGTMQDPKECLEGKFAIDTDAAGVIGEAVSQPGVGR